MRLERAVMQQLKDKKMQFDDLDEQYFIDSNGSVEDENVFELLEDKICDFKEIVDAYKNLSSLYKLLESERLFQAFAEKKLVSDDDLNYLLSKLDNAFEFSSLFDNILSFDYFTDSSRVNSKFFSDLFIRFKAVLSTTEFLKDKFTKMFYNEQLFKKLLDNNVLSTDNLKCLLKLVENRSELIGLCFNTPLTLAILKTSLFDLETVDRLNAILDEDVWCRISMFNVQIYKEDVHDVFDFIIHVHDASSQKVADRSSIRLCNDKLDQETVELAKLNKKIYALNNFNLSTDQKLEVSEILMNSTHSLFLLKQIIDNNLEDQYDFEALKSLLTKDEKKTLKTKFNF